MDKKEIKIRLVRSICFALVFGYIIMTLFMFILPTYDQTTSEILENVDGVSLISLIIFFFIMILTPLPLTKRNLPLIIRSILISLLTSYLVFVMAIQLGDEGIQGMPIVPMMIVMGPVFFVGLILFSWKKK